MSRKYNKKGETALLDDDSLSSTPASSRDGSRRAAAAGGRSKQQQQRQAEAAAAPPPEVEDEEDEEPKGFFSSKTNIIGAVVSVLVILAIIAGVAWFLLSAPAASPAGPGLSPFAALLLSSVDRSELASNFKVVTNYSTLAGTRPSRQAVQFVQDSFTASFAANASIATSTVHEYYGLFNYPAGYDANSSSPSAAAAQGSRRLSKLVNGTVVFTANLTENVIDMDGATKRTDAVPTCQLPPSAQLTHITRHSTIIPQCSTPFIQCMLMLCVCVTRLCAAVALSDWLCVSQRVQSQHERRPDRACVLCQLRHAGRLRILGQARLQHDRQDSHRSVSEPSTHRHTRTASQYRSAEAADKGACLRFSRTDTGCVSV